MDRSCAIVGGGLAGFVAYVTLRHGGLEPGEIAVFGTDPDPVAAWRPRAEAIRQRRMRSESDGHCYPRSFPGLAPREAVRRRSVAPLVQTVCNRYRPTIQEFLRHVEELRVRCGWEESFRRHAVARVAAAPGGFDVDAEGRFRHVLLALGHPGLASPPELADDPRTVHAYEPHDYADRVAVVGAGMAAATEWLNALAAGAEVVSVRRREPARRPLNVPRPLFSKAGLAAFHAAERVRKVELLTGFGTPSYPPGREWDEPIEWAMREGRFRVSRSVNGEVQVICATGFRRGFEHDALLRRFVEEHELDVEERWIVLAPDGTVPALTDRTRTLALTGVPAQWAYPAADTLVGMKYVARRFLGKVRACPTP
ncbi:MAG TPA: FAD-dependent oxidoreductase [Gaiellaceae bacterium]|nr:FAD-dependent oxidoreductase [Gaiellaceae bacterium]